MTALVEVVPAALAGERVDRVVALITGLSRADVASLVSEGAVRLAGRAVSRSTRVAEGDTVEVDVPTPTPTVLTPDHDAELQVVHEDADVLVIDKAPGMVVHPGHGNREGTLVHALLARYPEIAAVGDTGRPGIVHRLDKGTSGLMLVARSAEAHRGLVAAMAARVVVRQYLALVWGTVEASAGVIDAPIGRSTRDPTRMAVSTGGRDARTRYRRLRTFSEPVAVSLLECGLETGRTHQIRVHVAAIGHPVVGDDRYGGRRPALPSPRPALHANELAFDHPVTGEALSFRSPLPADLQAVLVQLR